MMDRYFDRARKLSLPASVLGLFLFVGLGVAHLQDPSMATARFIQFTNVTSAAGITFTHLRGNDGIPTNLEIFGPGVCVADFDGDGYQDIYFVNGRDLHNKGISVRNALYRNNG